MLDQLSLQSKTTGVCVYVTVVIVPIETLPANESFLYPEQSWCASE